MLGSARGRSTIGGRSNEKAAAAHCYATAAWLGLGLNGVSSAAYGISMKVPESVSTREPPRISRREKVRSV